MKLIVRQLGLRDYEKTWQAMRIFTEQRETNTPSELWLVEHPSVFTQGQAGKPEHIFNLGDIPLVQSDRGGQVTYHGPGQLIIYILLDLKKADLGIRTLVTIMENSIIQLLSEQGINAQSRQKAPGVYVNNNKIASLGLRVKRGYSYHGLALNLNMDLSPFSRINPCGLTDIGITQVTDHGVTLSLEETGKILSQLIANSLGAQLEFKSD